MKFQWCPTGCEGGSGIGRTQWRSYLRGKSWGLPRLWWHHCQGEVRWEVGMWKWSSNDDNFYFSPIPCIKEPFWPLDSFFCLINLVKGAKVLPPLPGHSSHFNTLSVCFSSHTKMPYTGWLKKEEFVLGSQFWSLEVQDQGVGRAGGWLLLVSSQDLPLYVCVLISFSYRDTNHIGLRPIWMTSFDLSHLFKDIIQRELSYTVGGNVNWYNHYGKQYGGSLKY